MNVDKARDFFSAYYEGDLDKGLREALDRKFASDSRLRGEYEAFAATMASLSTLSEPVPEPDFDLHERIAARLDRHLWEADQRRKPALLQWWKSVALGGIAVAALVTALFQINGSGGNVVKAELVPSNSAVGQVAFNIEDAGQLRLNYSTKIPQRVDIRTYEGNVLQSNMVGELGIDSPLNNDSDAATILEIDIQGKPAAYAVLPGKTATHVLEGTGTVADFLRAASNHFRVPIAIAELDLRAALTWKIELTDAYECLQQQLAGMGTVEKRSNGILWISSN